jgi:AcrR family transcriptional regulator
VAGTNRRKAEGEASRERILDAAAEMAGERGYEGTSINGIVERSGLPASSIYWHFKDKDELLAAVIDRSFARWLEETHPPAGTAEGLEVDQAMHDVLRRSGAALAKFPDFLRLGLMLMLERRPQEPTARTKFLEVRKTAANIIRRAYLTFFSDLAAGDIEGLVTLTLALSDGLFIAGEVDDLDLGEAFDWQATAILGAAEQIRQSKHRSRSSR